MNHSVIPLSLKDAPALIERLLPVQKLSAEAYKEQMAGTGKTLTPLGSYWKGRKPLILNKACVLGCLLPATSNTARDLEIFEELMAMDDESLALRTDRRPSPGEISATLSAADVARYFVVEPADSRSNDAPAESSTATPTVATVTWRRDLPEVERLRLQSLMLTRLPYRVRVDRARRPEEVPGSSRPYLGSGKPPPRHLRALIS